MEHFVEQQNVALLQRRLSEETNEDRKAVIRAVLQESQRRLALIEAALLGAAPPWIIPDRLQLASLAPSMNRQVATLLERSLTPSLLVDPAPGLHIVDANQHYTAAAMIDIGRVAGERLFDVFPDNPEDPSADGVAKLFASLQTVVETDRPHSMAIQRYDVRDDHGRFVERYWQPLNSPILDETGKLIFILHQVVEVTDRVRLNKAGN